LICSIYDDDDDYDYYYYYYVVVVKKKELMFIDFPYIQFKEQPEKTGMIVCVRVLDVLVFIMTFISKLERKLVTKFYNRINLEYECIFNLCILLYVYNYGMEIRLHNNCVLIYV
jgi:hypothetical protein